MLGSIRQTATVASSALRRTVSAVPRRTLATASASVSSKFARGSSARWFGLAAAATAAAVVVATQTEPIAAAAAEPGLNAKEFVPLKLVKRVRYNHNTDIFEFALSDPKAALNLPVSSCIVTKYVDAETGKPVIRPYTPIHQHERGVVRLLVKDYEQGKMSRHIHSLKVGDSLEIKGPIEKLAYQTNFKKQIGMVAGGTGVAPMLQVIDEVLRNSSDRTEVSLLFANTTKQDILLREEIDALAKKHANFKVTYLIDKPEAGWTGPTGFVNADLLKKTMPKPSTDSLVYVCGPPGFMNVISGSKKSPQDQGPIVGALKELGYDENNVYKF